MDFDLKPEQRDIWQWAKEFADKEIAPQVEEFDQKQAFNHDLLKKIAEQGFLSVIDPEQYGGQVGMMSLPLAMID